MTRDSNPSRIPDPVARGLKEIRKLRKWAADLNREADHLDTGDEFCQRMARGYRREADIYTEQARFMETRLQVWAARDRDGSGEAGQTAKQAGPVGQQRGPERHRPTPVASHPQEKR